MSGPQGHSYVHTEQSVAFSHSCASGADVGSSSWAPHPWLDLAQPAGSEATWHPGWPSKQPSPVGRCCSGLSLRLLLCAATGDVDSIPAATKKIKAIVRAFLTLRFYCAVIYILKTQWGSFFCGAGCAAFGEVNFHKSLRLIQLLQLRDGGITL